MKQSDLKISFLEGFKYEFNCFHGHHYLNFSHLMNYFPLVEFSRNWSISSIVTFMSINLFVGCPYCLFSGSRICSTSPNFIWYWWSVSSLIFVVVVVVCILSIVLANFFIFKITFLFYTLFSYSISLISAVIILISFLLLAWV